MSSNKTSHKIRARESNADGTASRRAALALLDGVLRRKVPLDDLLGDSGDRSAVAKLTPRDRAHARLLTTTTLRRLGQIDKILKGLMTHPKRARKVQNILRLGAAQLLFLDTPPHAAVNSAVQLTEATARPFKGMVNAILRRIDRERDAFLAQPETAAEQNTPDWLWQSWTRTYGAERARAIADAHLITPPLDLTPRSPDSNADLAKSLEAETLPNGSLRRTAGGRVDELPGFADGLWWVQDAAAAIPARLLGDVTGLDLKGQCGVDLCAAPGGKTAQLAAMGAQVIAVDRDQRRLDRLAKNMKRLDLTAEIVCADTTKWRPADLLDFALLDAPCSATGTLRRHPDIARLKSPEDIASLATLQSRMLNAAAKMIKPGGLLVYCTCSLQPEEGPDRIAEFLASHPSFKRAPVQAAELPGLKDAITASGDVRTLPSHWAERGGIDGFYICRMRLAGDQAS